MTPKMTMQTKRVLEELLRSRDVYGLDLCERTGLPGGTIYPILARLEQAGWVDSFWEDPREHEAQRRPRRRYYRLNPDGAQRAKQALAVTYRAGKKVWPGIQKGMA